MAWLVAATIIAFIVWYTSSDRLISGIPIPAGAYIDMADYEFKKRSVAQWRTHYMSKPELPHNYTLTVTNALLRMAHGDKL